MFNKESERYLSDDHRKNGDQAFESAFSNQGPEFESAFQEEKAEKRHFFLTLVLPLILFKCELDVGLLMSITKRKKDYYLSYNSVDRGHW